MAKTILDFFKKKKDKPKKKATGQPFSARARVKQIKDIKSRRQKLLDEIQ